MKKEHYQQLDDIDKKLERLYFLEGLASNLAFDEADPTNEEECHLYMLLDELQDSLKNVRKTISAILNDAGVI